MNIGYARVSTETQNGNGQVKELEKVCDKVHMEYASGGHWDRPALQNLLDLSSLAMSWLSGSLTG